MNIESLRMMRFIVVCMFYTLCSGIVAPGLTFASGKPCNEIQSWLFNQTWSTKQDNYPGDGSFAMSCGVDICDIAVPINRPQRKYVIQENTILLNYGMEDHEIEEIKIIELTDSHIKLKFPDIEDIHTFYRIK